MNEHQERSLWATAFRQLADAVDKGEAPMPTSAALWTQYVTPEELLMVADTSGPESYPITMTEDYANVSIPTGKLLELQVKWNIHVSFRRMDAIDAAKARRAFAAHNASCVRFEDDAEPEEADNHRAMKPSIVKEEACPAPNGADPDHANSDA